MKLVIFLAFVLFCSPAFGQIVAYQNSSVTTFSDNSLTTLSADTHHKPQKNKVATGGIMTLCGGVITYWGARLIISQRYEMTPDVNHQYAGVALVVFGGAMAITGIVVAVIGINERSHRHYALRMIAPKNNEIGVAYNFR